MNETTFGGPIYRGSGLFVRLQTIKTLPMEFNRRHFRTRDIRNDFFRRREYKSEDYAGHTRRIRLKRISIRPCILIASSRNLLIKYIIKISLSDV